MGVILMTFTCLSNIVKTLKRKEIVMSTIIHIVEKSISSHRTLINAGIILLSASLVAIYIDIMTAQTIAPPGIRILDFLWRAFYWLGN